VVYLLVFHTYINEMHGSRSKIPIKKNLVRQSCTEGFNSGIKGLNIKKVNVNSYTNASTTVDIIRSKVTYRNSLFQWYPTANHCAYKGPHIDWE
jgi:hypothetical protein